MSDGNVSRICIKAMLVYSQLCCVSASVVGKSTLYASLYKALSKKALPKSHKAQNDAALIVGECEAQGPSTREQARMRLHGSFQEVGSRQQLVEEPIQGVCVPMNSITAARCRFGGRHEAVPQA